MRNKHYWHAAGWFCVACVPGLGLYAEWQIHEHASVGGIVWLVLALAAAVIEIRRGKRSRTKS